MNPTNHTILFRPSVDPDEFAVLCEHPAWQGRVATSRTSLGKTHYSWGLRPVIARYAALPFYDELWADLAVAGARLVNTPKQHRWIADATEWTATLGEDLTPPAYDADRFYLRPDRAYVLKGRTNSRKGKWNTHMFAPDLAAVPRVLGRLLDDTYIAEQGVVMRPYVPLRAFDVAVSGCPVANEWRTFWWGPDTLIAAGWYWQNFPEHEPAGGIPREALETAHRAASLAEAPFVCIDVAERAEGGWIVVDVNDGQQSGLGDIDAATFYTSLAKAAWTREQA